MKMIYTGILLLISQLIQAQDTLLLTRNEAEAAFLSANLSLLAEKLNIEQEKAEVIQAKLWPNPSFSISEINLWATKGQRNGEVVSPPFFGSKNFGKNQQVAFQLEQLIQTAGKRKKMIALQEVDVKKAEQYFEELLRNLKYEFRNQLTQLQYLQLTTAVYDKQLLSIKDIVTVYEKQAGEGNIPRAEYLRLKALELEIFKSINELELETNDAVKELKVLLNLPATTFVSIHTADFEQNVSSVADIPVAKLINAAYNSRPDLKLAGMEQEYQQRLYQYERAQRVPDFAVQMNYDRNGNTMRDFVGVGVALDLPLFNKNQGNIKKAQLGIEQAKITAKQTTNTVENEIGLSYTNLISAVKFQQKIANNYEAALDDLLTSYTRNYKARNIGLLEYIDILTAYIDNRKTILGAARSVKEKTEELHFVVGQDVTLIP